MTRNEAILAIASALAAPVAGAIKFALKSLRKPKGTPMSDLPEAADATVQVLTAAAPIVTAVAADLAPAPTVNPSSVVNSVVATVQAHPDVHPSKAPAIIASILSGLYQAEPAIFAITRAGAKTQGAVGLGLGLAEIILGAFLHPGE